jgi:hypothetical protein
MIPAFAFVDNVDLIQEIKDNDLTLPQKIVNCWEESLISTGGALVPEKYDTQSFNSYERIMIGK